MSVVRSMLEWAWTWAHETGRYVVPETILTRTEYGDITVPMGFLFDGASCAPNGPRNETMKAAAVHDWLYMNAKFDDGGHCPRPVADALLRKYMLAAGCAEWICEVYHRAVRSFGWIPWDKYRMLEARSALKIPIVHTDYWELNGWEFRKARLKKRDI